jgi:hypothetical protein
MARHTPEQRKANLRLALILVSLAAVLGGGYVVRVVLFGA